VTSRVGDEGRAVPELTRESTSPLDDSEVRALVAERLKRLDALDRR
jgi:hypothetical protein